MNKPTPSPAPAPNGFPYVLGLYIGQRVKIVAITDDTLNPAWLGMEGEIIGIESSGLCGSSETDPAFIVSLSESTAPLMFWREEIAPADRPPANPNRRRWKRF